MNPNNNHVPKETETIAARRAARLSKKILEARERVGIGKAWWSNAIVEALALIFIFSLNLYLILPFFSTPAPDNTFSGPVMPLLVKLVGTFGTSTANSIQIANIFFFLLLPFSLYLFIRFLTKRKLAAILAILFISLPIYPFAEIRIDASFLGTDAAHIASLAVIPIALFGLLSFIRKGGASSLVVASVASAAVALISPFSFVTYLIFAFISTFSEMLLGKARLKIFRLLTVLIFAGGLNSFWYNPGFFSWMISGPMGQEIWSTVSKLVPISFFALPVLGVFGYLLFDRKPQLQPVFLASFYTIAFLMIALAGGGVFPSHPSRYIYEFGLSLAFFLSIIIVRFSDYLKLSSNPKIAKWNKKVLANSMLTGILLLLIAGIVVGRYRLLGDGSQVLGIWEGVEKGEIWLAKDRFSGAFSALGYTISGTTLFLLSFLGIKSRTLSH